jgi:hypothetical protein
MDVIRTIKPGRPGSIRFYQGWGEKLVAVRYRRDTEKNKIYTTLELIVDGREQAPGNHLISRCCLCTLTGDDSRWPSP